MIVSRLKIEIPDKCPEKCPYTFMYQGDTCSRCPIFNCRKIVDDEGEFCLIEPEDYSEELALYYKEMFDLLDKGN